MVHRRIFNNAKEMALAMSLQGIRLSEVRQLTGVSESSLKRLRSTHRKAGTASIKATAPERMLTLAEVQVCHTFLKHPASVFHAILVHLRLCRAPARHIPLRAAN